MSLLSFNSPLLVQSRRLFILCCHLTMHSFYTSLLNYYLSIESIDSTSISSPERSKSCFSLGTVLFCRLLLYDIPSMISSYMWSCHPWGIWEIRLFKMTAIFSCKNTKIVLISVLFNLETYFFFVDCVFHIAWKKKV